MPGFAEAEEGEEAVAPVPAAGVVLACMRCSRSCTEAAASVVNRSVVMPSEEPAAAAAEAPVPADADADAAPPPAVPVPVPVPDAAAAAVRRSSEGTAPHMASADR